MKTLGERDENEREQTTKKSEGGKEEEEAFITWTEIKVLMARVCRAHDAVTRPRSRDVDPR